MAKKIRITKKVVVLTAVTGSLLIMASITANTIWEAKQAAAATEEAVSAEIETMTTSKVNVISAEEDVTTEEEKDVISAREAVTKTEVHVCTNPKKSVSKEQKEISATTVATMTI